MSKISVIIRVKNEERWVGHSIQSVLDFIDKPEIIIVDNNSSDESLQNVKLFKEDPNLKGKNKNYTKIKIVNISNYSPGRALNLGIKNATGEYILIISAHCVLKKINVKQHKKDLEKNVAIFGKQNPIYVGKKISRKYIWDHFINKKINNMYSNYENRYFFHNGISFFKKKTLKKYSFDENLTHKEDRYWINKIVKNKMNYLYDPNMEVDHHFTTDGNTWKNI